MEGIRRNCNPMVDLFPYIFNKKSIELCIIAKSYYSNLNPSQPKLYVCLKCNCALIIMGKDLLPLKSSNFRLIFRYIYDAWSLFDFV